MTVQPVNLEPESGVAVNVTVPPKAVGPQVPEVATPFHEQEIPEGDELIVPDPTPDAAAVMLKVGGGLEENVAVIFVIPFSPLVVMSQVVVPEHPVPQLAAGVQPDQPVKVSPRGAGAVSLTWAELSPERKQ